MKNLKITLTSILSIFVFSAIAQDRPSEVTKEVSEKTLKIVKNDKTIENSVRITTEIYQGVMTEDEDAKKINQERVFPPKTVVKLVEIDNDADNFYDERIKFSYITNERTDFTLISNNNEVMIAVEEGDNVTLLENQRMFVESDAKKSFVYTDDNGSKIEFKIENELNKDSK